MEPISYAMRNHEAVQSLIYFNSPFQLKNWTFILIESITILGAFLGLFHAILAYKIKGTKSNLFTWLACLFYGLFLEIIVYNYVDNFWHGEFTVMFYYNRFPLYISLLYPALLYHICFIVKRFEFTRLPFGRWIEAISIGFWAQIYYLLYDNLGPELHWWIWDPDHPTLQPFWNSVPATSYHWIFAFSICFALLARLVIWEWGKARNFGMIKMTFLAAFVGISTSVIGPLLFLPFNFIVYELKMTTLAGFLLACYLISAGWLFLAAPKKVSGGNDRLLSLFPMFWCSCFLGLYAYLFDTLYKTGTDGITPYGTPIGNWVISGIGIFFAIYLLKAAKLIDNQ